MANNRIDINIKNKILKSIHEDWIQVRELAKEYWVHHKTIYNWLNKETQINWWDNASLAEIKRLNKDKEDLLMIIWELTAELNLSKKKRLK